MDLQAAADGGNIGDNDSATAILRDDHQSLRKAFGQYRELMNDAAAQRAALAQDICMQIELHFSITREIFYPAMAAHAAPLIRNLAHGQEDIQQCIDMLRHAQPLAEPELDSTMIRLMELGDIYICRERELIAAASTAAGADLHAMGARMIRRRESIAGAVRDLDGRS
jgi:hypothetical protein